LPNRLKQTIIFVTRDTLSKLSNKQYLLINLLEAPLLAIILAVIIKYRSAPGGREYMFRFNENFPAFLLMSIIVALFMGLTVSAEEIIRDRKILRRESFLNLSWNSYLMSKLMILFTLAALQTFSFVLIGNLILEIEWKMLLPFWFILFTTSCFASVLGLNISSAFNSAVTVYVMIPLLLIPQMILSGLLFSFDKLNDIISTKGKVPIVADMMASRWAYEALVVDQFMNNSFEAPYYLTEKYESQADFRSAYLIGELDKKRKFIADNLDTKSDSVRNILSKDLTIIQNVIRKDFFKKGLEKFLVSDWTLEKFTPDFNAALEQFFTSYKKFYQDAYNLAVIRKERLITEFEKKGDYNLNRYKDRYYNESLADLVKNVSEKDRIIEYKGSLYQQINPIFLDPIPSGPLDYRAHFFAPQKNLFGFTVSTFLFNTLVIWCMTVVLYVTLYFELLRKLINSFAGLPVTVPRPKADQVKKA
ncbi:MAG TPA: ABC transporter permease, partial [Chryseolinea sp.]|nr:ABC transporter permease [Chryseolinea sp.]